MSEPEEIPHASILSSIFEKEELQDVILQGNDNVKVSSCRFVLAARSKVFQKLLLGGFAEASKPIVDLNYEGDVLQAIVEFCYTDDALLIATGPLETSSTRTIDEKWIHSIVCLAEASKYFALPLLARKIAECVAFWLAEDEYIYWKRAQDNDNTFGCIRLDVCLLLAECKVGGDAVGELKEFAYSWIRSEPTVLVREHSTMLWRLPPSDIEAILRDNHLGATELDIFHILHKWSKDSIEAHNSASQLVRYSNLQHDKITELSKFVNLDRIKPERLANEVETSGIVSTEQLLKAYKLHALRQENCSDGIHKRRRGDINAAWASSGTTQLDCIPERLQDASSFFVDKLHCPVMKSGIFRWRIHIHKVNDDSDVYTAGLGIVSVGAQIVPDHYLGSNEVGWEYTRDGDFFNNCDQLYSGLPQFGLGSTVTFLFDLTNYAEDSVTPKGSLCVSVDGMPMESVPCDIKISGGRNWGFVPAVSLVAGESVTLHQFDKIA